MSFWNGKTVSVDEVDFAKRAATYFRSHPTKHTFTDGDCKPGELLAIKWAFNADSIYSIAVVRVSSATLVEDV